jgi:hypothetical protein
MINIDFTEEEMKALNYERFYHPDPNVQRKMEAFWLKSQKLSHKTYADLQESLQIPCADIFGHI